MFSTYEVIACRGGFVLTLGLNTQIWMHSCWSHTSWRDCCKSCVFDTSEAIKQDGMHAHIRAKRMKLTARYSQLTFVSMQRKRKARHQRVQICLSWRLCFVFFTLLTSCSPNLCSGECSNIMYPLRSCPKVLLTLSRFCLSFSMARTLTCLYTPQPSRRGPECRSKVPSTHASNCRQKANVWKAYTDRSGRGTYHVSPTWAACSLVRNRSTATYRSGTCRGWRICVTCFVVQLLSTVTSQSGTCHVWTICLVCFVAQHFSNATFAGLLGSIQVQSTRTCLKERLEDQYRRLFAL